MQKLLCAAADTLQSKYQIAKFLIYIEFKIKIQQNIWWKL